MIEGSYRFAGQDLVQLRIVYSDLIQLISAKGPFGGVIGFSEGGAVAASLLVQDALQPFHHFRCGIFFCSATPMDPAIMETGIDRTLDFAADGIMINIPTAHIWSRAGDFHPGMGQCLMSLCHEGSREEFVHNLGHDVPGSRSAEGLSGALLAIERTIERAGS